MKTPNWVKDQIPRHLSPRVQSTMRKHLLREYHRTQEEYRKANLLLTFKPIFPEQDLNMETELMLMYQWGES